MICVSENIILSLFLTSSDRAIINVLRSFLVTLDEIVCLYQLLTRFYIILVLCSNIIAFPRVIEL